MGPNGQPGVPTHGYATVVVLPSPQSTTSVPGSNSGSVIDPLRVARSPSSMSRLSAKMQMLVRSHQSFRTSAGGSSFITLTSGAAQAWFPVASLIWYGNDATPPSNPSSGV